MAAPFRFRLERVRALRERAEDEAKEHLAVALRERERLAGCVADAVTRLDLARAGQRTGGGSIEALLAHQAFVERGEREIHAAELELSRHDAEVDACRFALQEAARERAVLEQLKDKAEREHRVEAERRESGRIDELALAMHRRRSVA